MPLVGPIAETISRITHLKNSTPKFIKNLRLNRPTGLHQVTHEHKNLNKHFGLKLDLLNQAEWLFTDTGNSRKTEFEDKLNEIFSNPDSNKKIYLKKHRFSENDSDNLYQVKGNWLNNRKYPNTNIISSQLYLKREDPHGFENEPSIYLGVEYQGNSNGNKIFTHTVEAPIIGVSKDFGTDIYINFLNENESATRILNDSCEKFD